MGCRQEPPHENNIQTTGKAGTGEREAMDTTPAPPGWRIVGRVVPVPLPVTSEQCKRMQKKAFPCFAQQGRKRLQNPIAKKKGLQR